MASMAISTPFGFAAASSVSVSPSPSAPRFGLSASLYHVGLLVRTNGLPVKLNEQTQRHGALRYDAVIEAKKGNPPIMPAVMTPGGPLDLSTVLLCNRIIFIGQPIHSQVAQCVISQLLTLAAIDENAYILVYLNYPGGSIHSVLAIYDCMSSKIDKLYAAFTGQPLEKVQQHTERDRFFSSSEALEFGLIDGVLEMEY